MQNTGDKRKQYENTLNEMGFSHPEIHVNLICGKMHISVAKSTFVR